MDRHERAVLDLGTGDGAAVLRLARREPRTLVIGVDTDADALRQASHRAAQKPSRGGLGNALFLAGTLEELPAALGERLDEVRVTLPWGSLLHVALAPDSGFGTHILGLLRPGGAFQLMLSLVERDQRTGAEPLGEAQLTELVEEYRDAGFRRVSVSPASVDDVLASGSTWAKRLGIPSRRPAWMLRAERPE